MNNNIYIHQNFVKNSYNSPEYVRISLAASITLNLATGTFYRNARLKCINLLLTYPNGCLANCAFCGLSQKDYNHYSYDKKKTKFIRVTWNNWPLETILERINKNLKLVERVCISMITNPQAKNDTLKICKLIYSRTGLPISILIAPTLLKDKIYLIELIKSGADRIGIAIDTATQKLFEQLRGPIVSGPHRWSHYWSIYKQAISVFGLNRVGVHLIHGLGENEQEMIMTINYIKKTGGTTHLFSFFPEKFSILKNLPQANVNSYRRIQMARWLIDKNLTKATNMDFNQQGQLINFGVNESTIESALLSGEPFMTSGCPGGSGEVACNRPYANEKPGKNLRNYPFPLEPKDIALVQTQIMTY